MDSFLHNSSLVCKRASVSSDQPLASSIGKDILRQGGNAADAAVATMLAVSVVQPKACGLGGDTQCLFYRNADKTIRAINGSGRTGKNAYMSKIREAGIEDSKSAGYRNHGLWVSVPGAVAAMFDVVKHFGSGKLTMEDILAPVIELAEEGAPVPYKQVHQWKKYCDNIKKSRNAEDLSIDGNAPEPGDIMKAPKLAQCLKKIAKSGPEAFYFGDTAQQIIKAVQEAGGVLMLDDLADHIHRPPHDNPMGAICVDFHGFRVWEMKPNTIGIVALVTLNILKGYDLKALGHNSSEYIHIISEAIKYAYLECWDNLCDPSFSPKSVENLLTEETAKKLRHKIDPKSTCKNSVQFSGGNTSYVAVVDEEGNGCSFISSVSSSFGSGIIPDECGFVLHDRAKCMSSDEQSPNAFGPGKLSLHTIIPSLVTEASTGELLAVFGVMGRWMQPQGQVQVFLNMVVFGMDPQVALNQTRFFVGNPNTYPEYIDSLEMLCLEGGINTDVVPHLESKGHSCCHLSGADRECFGRGHVITRSRLFDPTSRSDCWWSGADPRSDGCAMGY